MRSSHTITLGSVLKEDKLGVYEGGQEEVGGMYMLITLSVLLCMEAWMEDSSHVRSVFGMSVLVCEEVSMNSTSLRMSVRRPPPPLL